MLKYIDIYLYCDLQYSQVSTPNPAMGFVILERTGEKPNGSFLGIT